MPQQTKVVSPSERTCRIGIDGIRLPSEPDRNPVRWYRINARFPGTAGIQDRGDGREGSKHLPDWPEQSHPKGAPH
ncbi:MAG: hypothetical protein JW829_02990 [Pirellulales bacterium]|nr:hypothetical protein [Pirellulales bacterium]